MSEGERAEQRHPRGLHQRQRGELQNHTIACVRYSSVRYRIYSSRALFEHMHATNSFRMDRVLRRSLPTQPTHPNPTTHSPLPSPCRASIHQAPCLPIFSTACCTSCTNSSPTRSIMPARSPPSSTCMPTRPKLCTTFTHSGASGGWRASFTERFQVSGIVVIAAAACSCST